MKTQRIHGHGRLSRLHKEETLVSVEGARSVIMLIIQSVSFNPIENTDTILSVFETKITTALEMYSMCTIT